MSNKNLLIEEMDDDLQSRHLCKDCVSETVFSDFIKENGQKGKCAFCNKNKNNVIALGRVINYNLLDCEPHFSGTVGTFRLGDAETQKLEETKKNSAAPCKNL